jgi:hypothetical protein
MARTVGQIIPRGTADSSPVCLRRFTTRSNMDAGTPASYELALQSGSGPTADSTVSIIYTRIWVNLSPLPDRP